MFLFFIRVIRVIRGLFSIFFAGDRNRGTVSFGTTNHTNHTNAATVFTFARAGATVAMTVDDDYAQGKRSWLRLHEKGGKQHEMPARHTLEEYIDAFIKAAGIAADASGRLFRTAPGTKATLTRNPLSTADVWRMIWRRLRQTGIRTKAGCHSFRATGITRYLEGKGTLEKAQQMASHSSPRMTKLYDRTSDQITLDEVEKIVI